MNDVVDPGDRTVGGLGVRNVANDQINPLKVVKVLFPTGREIVDDANSVTARNQFFADV